MSVSCAEWQTIEKEEAVTSKSIAEMPEVKSCKTPVVVIVTDDNDEAFKKAIGELSVKYDLNKVTFIRIKSSQKAPYKAMIFNKGKQVGKTVSLNDKGLKTFAKTLKSLVK